MAKKIVPIPEELELRNQLYKALQGDAVLKVMNLLNCSKSSTKNFIEELEESGSYKLDEETIKNLPDDLKNLYQTFNEVKETLGFNQDVLLYTTLTSNVNACAAASQTKGEPHVIVINSVMTKLLTKDEIKVVIGHELGHIISETKTLERIFNFVYPEEGDLEGLMYDKYLLWSRMSELVADRYGYLACPNLEVNFSVYSKLDTGLNFYDLGYQNLELYIGELEQNLEDICKTDELNQHTHPLSTLRSTSIYLMHLKQKGYIHEDDYKDKMGYLINVLHKQEYDSEIHELMSRATVLAGYKLASVDGEVSKEELEHLFDILSTNQMIPWNYYNDWVALSEETRDAEFDKAIKKILKVDETFGEKLITFLANMAVADDKLDVKEIDLVLAIGKKVRLEKEEVALVFGDVIKNNFAPSILTI